MSMLTPPGMGGKYRITGNRYPRMRRPRGRRRIVLALIGGTVALGLAGWGTTQLIDVFSGGDEGTGTARAGAQCARGDLSQHGKDSGTPRTTAAKAFPKPSDITVNVYNATKRTGLAKETAEALKKRGFTIGKVGNAPATYDKKVKASGLLLGAPGTGQRLDVLGTQVSGAQTKNDAREGKEVDLIIGDSFTDLVDKKDAARAMAALAEPTPPPTKGRC